MARTRVIDRDAVLDAAERVVSRDGAARMTLEAVAHEAGISKASVLYDYKTKQALIKAVIERRVARENQRLRECIENLGPVPDAVVRGRIASTTRLMSEADRAVVLNLVAALAGDAGLRSSINEAYSQQIEQINQTSTQPGTAMLAFLAVEGLRLMECFGLYSWSQNERERMLNDIENFLQRDLVPVSVAAKS
jgi:AcrR family transcriptional regulator